MNDKRTVEYHPEYPAKTWIVIEQPCHEPFRYQFNPVTSTFQRTRFKSLLYERGFSGAYGWIAGSGVPPGPHYDVLLITQFDLQPGDIVLGHICGVFLRGDGDHKFVALDDSYRADLVQADISLLSAKMRAELERLYPVVGAQEGWFGCQVAIDHLKRNSPVHD